MLNNKKPVMSAHRLPLLMLVMLVMFWSCDRTRTDKGYEYFPDMVHSQAYETYSENNVWEDGQTMRKPAEGTIPRDIVPYSFAEINPDDERPGKELENPLTANQQILDEGKYLYDIFCASCHGDKGDGNGHLYTSGKYAIQPRSLTEQSVTDQTGGQIYHTISAGYGVMGQHASLIRPEDRWKIVTYVEKIIQNK
jgi:mono/diheme cytochrome c family protein